MSGGCSSTGEVGSDGRGDEGGRSPRDPNVETADDCPLSVIAPRGTKGGSCRVLVLAVGVAMITSGGGTRRSDVEAATSTIVSIDTVVICNLIPGVRHGDGATLLRSR